MPDLTERLHRYAAAAEHSVTPVDLGRLRKAQPRRRRAMVLLAAGMIVIAAVVGAGVVGLDDPSELERSTTDRSLGEGGPSATSSGEPAPTTPTTGPATRTQRTNAVVAFTGTEYLVWSGEAGLPDLSHRADGFAADVRSGAVRPIPPAPIAPRSGATGVWTGVALVVCCGGNQDGGVRSAAEWDPRARTWRTLAQPPESVSQFSATSVWTGGVMVVVARGSAAATYDPGSDRWSEIVAPPLGGRSPEAVWTGEEVIVWDARYGAGAGGGEVVDRGWRWAPGRPAWEPLPPLPEGSRTNLGSIGWTGQDVVVWGQSTGDPNQGTGARWRPGAQGWRALGPSPQGRLSEPYNGTPGSQAVTSDPGGGRVFVRGLQDQRSSDDALYVVDGATGAWSDAGVAVPGWHPTFTYAAGAVLVPDDARPVAGRLAP